jgi:hypothetical protein
LDTSPTTTNLDHSRHFCYPKLEPIIKYLITPFGVYIIEDKVSRKMTSTNDYSDPSFSAVKQNKLANDETSNYLLSTDDKNAVEALWWVGTDSNDNVVSSDDASLSSCGSELSSMGSSSAEEEETTQGFFHDVTGEQLLERNRQVSSPPPRTVVISKKLDTALASDAEAYLDPLPIPSSSQQRQQRNDPMWKLAQCMERSALSRSLVEAYCHASLELFKNKTTDAVNQPQKYNSKVKEVVSKRRESTKYPISKQIKGACFNRKKHQFFFGDKYSQGGQGEAGVNFRLTGLKFASSEKLMRLDEKMKMLSAVGSGIIR